MFFCDVSFIKILYFVIICYGEIWLLRWLYAIPAHINPKQELLYSFVVYILTLSTIRSVRLTRQYNVLGMTSRMPYLAVFVWTILIRFRLKRVSSLLAMPCPRLVVRSTRCVSVQLHALHQTNGPLRPFKHARVKARPITHSSQLNSALAGRLVCFLNSEMRSADWLPAHSRAGNRLAPVSYQLTSGLVAATAQSEFNILILFYV